MKTILFAFILFLASCSKQSIEQNRPVENVAQLATITFNQVSGGGTHIQFHVKLTTPVKKANLYQVPDKLVYYVSNPGLNFVMYHNGPDYPTYTQQVFYQLELIMEDGTKVLGDKFQVY
jgi:hypothetical protein